MNIEKILKLMKEQNMTRYKLAKMSGVSETQLKRLFIGKSKDPRLSTIKGIARALGVTIEEIVWKYDKEIWEKKWERKYRFFW